MQHFGCSARLLHAPVTPKVPFPSDSSMQSISQNKGLMPDDHRPRSVSNRSRTRPPSCIRRFVSQARPREGTWVLIIPVDVHVLQTLD